MIDKYIEDKFKVELYDLDFDKNKNSKYLRQVHG